jgi:hypothetical protein
MHDRGGCALQRDLEEGPDCFSAKVVRLGAPEVLSQISTTYRIDRDFLKIKSVFNGRLALYIYVIVIRFPRKCRRDSASRQDLSGVTPTTIAIVGIVEPHNEQLLWCPTCSSLRYEDCQ